MSQPNTEEQALQQPNGQQGGAGEQPADNNGGTSGAYTPPATQAEFDKIIADRLDRERKKFADYDQLKAQAAKYEQLEKANMTEQQRTAAEADALRKENAELKLSQLRAQVAAAKGVPAELIAGATEAEMEAAADRLLAFKGVTPKAPSATGQGTQAGGDVHDRKPMNAEEIVAAAGR